LFDKVLYMDTKFKYEEDLASIRSIMEKSAKFISLAGFSGVFLGVYALLGSLYAYWLLYYPAPPAGFQITGDRSDTLTNLIVAAAVVLLLAFITVYLMTSRKLRKQGETMVWNSSAKALVEHLLVPLATGGVFILILILKEQYEFVAPASLIFYGLSLVNASKFTYGDIKWLGYVQICLGLWAAFFPAYGLIFWATGFGLLNIIYGIVMYRKYDQ
jgi:hypothetical protein